MRDVWRVYFSKLPVLEVDGVGWTLEDYEHRLMQRWDGEILGGDASFKFAKIIRLGAKAGEDRTRPVYGIVTMFNEYEQVVFSCLCFVPPSPNPLCWCHVFFFAITRHNSRCIVRLF